MYERSQALAAHEQQQQEGSHLSSGDRQQRQHMVTPGDLSSALSSALRQAPPVPQPPPPTTHSSATPQSGTAISQDTLSTALAGVYWGSRGGQPPGQAQGAHPRGPTPSSAVPRSQREHYRQQVLHDGAVWGSPGELHDTRRVALCLCWVSTYLCQLGIVREDVWFVSVVCMCMCRCISGVRVCVCKHVNTM